MNYYDTVDSQYKLFQKINQYTGTSKKNSAPSLVYRQNFHQYVHVIINITTQSISPFQKWTSIIPWKHKISYNDAFNPIMNELH